MIRWLLRERLNFWSPQLDPGEVPHQSPEKRVQVPSTLREGSMTGSYIRFLHGHQPYYDEMSESVAGLRISGFLGQPCSGECSWPVGQSDNLKRKPLFYSLIPTEVWVIPICRRVQFNLHANTTVFWDQLPVLSIRSRSPTAFLQAASRLVAINH